MIGMSSVMPVDVPVEGAPQVAGRVGFFAGSRVTRKISGCSPVAEDLDPSQPLAERHLGGVVELEAAEDEHAVLVERLERPRRRAPRRRAAGPGRRRPPRRRRWGTASRG